MIEYETEKLYMLIEKEARAIFFRAVVARSDRSCHFLNSRVFKAGKPSACATSFSAEECLC
jgi:hypothetical protein